MPTPAQWSRTTHPAQPVADLATDDSNANGWGGASPIFCMGEGGTIPMSVPLSGDQRFSVRGSISTPSMRGAPRQPAARSISVAR